MSATALTTPSLSTHVYALHMYSQRLQILVSKEQRKRLESEARRRKTSVASVIRDAVDKELGRGSREDRLRAVAAIGKIEGIPYLPPDELRKAIDEARAEGIDRGFPEAQAG